jgi:hypothetical protein
MTTEEFDNTKWRGGMKIKYKGNEYKIYALDFDERLIAAKGVTMGTDEPNWLRCENCELVVL